jgi:hypothetical protein
VLGERSEEAEPAKWFLQFQTDRQMTMVTQYKNLPEPDKSLAGSIMGLYAVIPVERGIALPLFVPCIELEREGKTRIGNRNWQLSRRIL